MNDDSLRQEMKRLAEERLDEADLAALRYGGVGLLFRIQDGKIVYVETYIKRGRRAGSDCTAADEFDIRPEL